MSLPAQLAVRQVARARSIEDLRRLAKRRLPRAVFEFFDGGAEDEVTLRENRAAFERVRLLPKVLVNVARVDPSTTILGAGAGLPIAIAPTGAVGFGGHGADVAIARAAKEAGIPYALSTTATASIERIAPGGARPAVVPGLYPQAARLHARPRSRARSEAGYEALVITVDLPVGGKRERDFRNDFGIPFSFTRKNVLDFASRPLWALSMLRHGMPVMENLVGFTPEATNTAAVASSVGRNYDPSFDWDGLEGDARRLAAQADRQGRGPPRRRRARAVAMGCDAIIVSNHGGRQLDGGIATLDALPGVARGGRRAGAAYWSTAACAAASTSSRRWPLAPRQSWSAAPPCSAPAPAARRGPRGPSPSCARSSSAPCSYAARGPSRRSAPTCWHRPGRPPAVRRAGRAAGFAPAIRERV